METVNSSAPLIASSGQVLTARLIGRRARFLMDLEGERGRFTAHTNNTGSMLGLLRPGSEVLLSTSQAPARKYPHTVEAVKLDGFWVGVNTAAPGWVLRAAWAAGLVPELTGYDRFETEPRFAGGRLDARLTGTAGTLLVETKNVTMVEDCVAQFPDAPTERGRKHLMELTRISREGGRAALFFAVQRPDGRCFAPCRAVDPEYASLFHEALAAGVAALPFVVDVAPDGLRLGRRLEVAATW